MLRSKYTMIRDTPSTYPNVSSVRVLCDTELSVTSPIVINMPTRKLLAGETKNSFV